MADPASSHSHFDHEPLSGLLVRLAVNPRTGLSAAEVERRRQEHGYNEVAEMKPNLVRGLLDKFWGFSACMLELIIVVSWFLHKTQDVYLVSFLLVVNALVGFAQEQRASNAVHALRQRLRINVRVLRDAQWALIPARELVPGDIIRIRMGDLIPADVRLVSGDVGVDQSALTGESLQVDKHESDALYSGSIVGRGEATAVVVLTGADTYLGRTTELVQMARPKLHVDALIERMVQWLLAIVGVLMLVALVFSLARGTPVLDIMPLLLVLLLGAIPVSLPMLLTLSMALCSIELSRKGVLVTRLSAPEDAARMDVLCVDKTGTITENRLQAADLLSVGPFKPEHIVLYGALASQEANADPIDLAFLKAAQDHNVSLDCYHQEQFVPFSPQTRRTVAVVRHGERSLMAFKGAVGVLADVCELDDDTCLALEQHMSNWAQKGYRTLAVGVAEDSEAPQLVGLAALYDAPRSDSHVLIRQLHNLGVRVKMLTGDALPIARQIAREVGIGSELSSMAELDALAHEDAPAAVDMAEQSDGFAGIYPEGKYTVVKSLQAAGHIAKGAASAILTTDGLGTLIHLVSAGRLLHEHMRTWIINKFSRTVFKSLFIVIPFLMTGQYIISPFAALLCTFMTDFVKMTLSTDKASWRNEPEKWDWNGIVKPAVALGLIMCVEAMGLLHIGYHYLALGSHEGMLETFSFEILLYFALFSLLMLRERGHFWDSRPSKTTAIALAADALLGGVACTVGVAGLSAIPLSYTLLVFGYALVFSLIVNDAVKCTLFERFGLLGALART